MADDAALVEAEELPDTSYDLREQINNDSLHKELQRPSSLNLENNADIISPSSENIRDLIVAVFVVHFDTRKGNIIEWKYPRDIDLSEVEFKALASGSHTIMQDFVYFKTNDNLFGLSCFERITVDSVEERGSRMKSVGIICARYTSLHEHLPFLEDEVTKQLDNPGHYEDLRNYYDSFKHCIVRNNFVASPPPEHLPGLEEIPVLKITHPAGCFPQFINFFGEKMFILWKFVLLQKRILFFSPPPVGVACYRVYCACLLASHGIPFGFETGSNPLFFTNVCDLDTLQNEHKYIACTTEKIFEMKDDVWDVYIDNQNIRAKGHLNSLVHPNYADRERFETLDIYRRDQLINGGEVMDDEKMYTKYFVHLNNTLFQSLFEVASTPDRILTSEVIRRIGLDPKSDLGFLNDLTELYGINVQIPVPTCCPFYEAQYQ
ncbi:protein LCHN [Exaiptasia diaphana]|uniref:DENN domain-containing protein 11 n=1 Tax=Exaiptasia diaphana TaxID=2652724 RepID=A0A913XDI2_EXADI|nr:protein LCHN [Exaiptasia diaphana]KXJ13053.1 Protein LCHN [Exaiptasia diaphana]